MQKTYISPDIQVVPLTGSHSLLEGSMEVDASTLVNQTSDIGFVKEERSGSLWDDDWSE